MNFLLIIMAAVLSVFGNSLFRFGLRNASLQSLGFSYLAKNLVRVILEPFVLLGLVAFAISAIIWLRVISQETLIKSYPVFISLTLLFVIISSAVFLNESFTTTNVLGILLIVGGMLLVFFA